MKIVRFNLNKNISKEEISALEPITFDGNIHLIDCLEQAQVAAKKLSQENLIGFDTETRPSFKKGEFHHVSLLQLSTHTDAYLFRLNKINLPDFLITILESPKITKVGVAIRDDLKALKKLKPHNPSGFIELADIGKKMGVKKLGLRSMTAIFFSKKLSKRFRLTNWAKPHLNEDECKYAATDAWIGLKLYEKMTNS